MKIQVAESDAQILACFPVLRELRPQLEEASFVQRVRTLERSGYRLAYLEDAGAVVAVTGFRVGDSLAWGHYLYVDDLVTASSVRSRGFGAAVFAWLCDFAERQGCEQLHLESGVQRKGAHRFYLREGMELSSYHFSKHLPPRASRWTGLPKDAG